MCYAHPLSKQASPEPGSGRIFLAVFAKTVREGRVKTRLQSRFSRQEAEALYVASLADTLTVSLSSGEPVVLYLDGGQNRTRLGDLVERLRATGFAHTSEIIVRPQRGRDLGRRLEHAFRELRPPALIIGSDSPTLHPTMLHTGIGILRDHSSPYDAVVGPTTDGGYWGVGIRHFVPGLFAGVPWSTDRALTSTTSKFEAHGLRTAFIDTWTDMDTPDDVVVVAEQIRQYRSRGDASTGRFTEHVLRNLDVL